MAALQKILPHAAEKGSGIIITGDNKKKTHWWNTKVQEAVRKKKAAWKTCQRFKNDETYQEYKN